MKRRITSITFALVICFSLFAPVFGSSDGGAAPSLEENPVPTALKPLRLMDEENLLTPEQARALEDRLDEISLRHNFDVVIVTVSSLEGLSAQAYADNYYDKNYLNTGGMGEDGILFLLSTDDRDWAISTSGTGIPSFTDAGQRYIMEEKVLPYLKKDDYNGGFNEFASLSDEFLVQAATGDPYDSHNLPEKVKELFSLKRLLGSALVGAVLSFITMKGSAQSLKSVERKRTAAPYLLGGSLKVEETGTGDLFLYRNVNKTPRAKAEGSSTHTSSSGRTHGGSSGKF